MNRIAVRAEKVCNMCRKELPLEAFYRQVASPDGRQYRCKTCSQATKRAWDRDNAERLKAYNRQADIKRYGITIEAYADILARQGNACAICRSPLAEGKTHVDHDHSCCPPRRANTKACGECVRGLLCGPCNTGIGMFKDDPIRLQSAIDYLAR